MRNILTAAAIAAAALLLIACDDPDGARRALKAAGMTDIRTEGYAWLGCGKDDTFKTRFTATNPRGERVSGVVCTGWFKGGTIRFD